MDDLELVVLSKELPEEPRLDGLSEAEREVCLLAISGLGNAQIAARRGTTPRTVANQLQSAYRKLGVRGRRSFSAARARARSS